MEIQYKINYLCADWQGFIQQLVYLASRGYYYHCLVEFPLKKEKKWTKIDGKLIKKYDMDKSKYQRARAKVKKKANFMYLRWGSHAVIMHTEGQVDPNFKYNDNFKDIRVKFRRLTIPISDVIHIQIHLGTYGKDGKRHPSARLNKDSVAALKARFERIMMDKNKNLLVKEFDNLNGIPCWAGILEQKHAIKRYILARCKKHGIEIDDKELRFKTTRYAKKVFEA